jgi:hypothetical protein
MSGLAAWGQAAPPDLMRISHYKIRANGTYDFREGIKMVNDGYKKSGVPWRQAWQMSMFGETYTVVMVTPVKNFAQFDTPGPMAGLSAGDSVKYQTLMRNAIESSRHSLVRYAPELSVNSGTMQEPKFARVMTIRVKPGRVAEFEDAIKTLLLPAIRQAGIKDYWVDRMVLGGVTGEYTTLTPFTKWSELDSWPTTEKLLGASYKAFMAKIADTVDSSETLVAATVPELGYGAQ